MLSFQEPAVENKLKHQATETPDEKTAPPPQGTVSVSRFFTFWFMFVFYVYYVTLFYLCLNSFGPCVV